MTKYGFDGRGNCRMRNVEVGSATLTTDTSGLGNVSIAFAVRFNNTPIVVVTPMTTFSSYPGLTVVSSDATFVDIKVTRHGNISASFTIAYMAYDDGNKNGPF